MRLEYEFADAPPIGTVHEKFGQQYELVAVRPYTRKDGAPSSLLTWRTNCAKCGESFRITAGLKMRSLNRRCYEHADPHKPASKEARLSHRRGQRKGGAVRRAQMKAKRELLS